MYQSYILSCLLSLSALGTHAQLTATETMNYDDAFTLELVTEDLLDKFNFVAGIVPVLTTHIAKVCVLSLSLVATSSLLTTSVAVPWRCPAPS